MYLSIDRLITSEKLAPAPGLTAGHQPADILANISVVPELTPGSVRTINFTGKRLHHELITRRTINTAKQKALFRCEKITTNQVLKNRLLHIFCIKAKKCPSLSFLTEAQPRLNKRGQKALFWQRPTDGATVSVRKSAAEKELLFVRLIYCAGPDRSSVAHSSTNYIAVLSSTVAPTQVFYNDSSYSPDLAPRDFFLFKDLKESYGVEDVRMAMMGGNGNFVPVQLTWSCLHWRAVFGRPRPPAGHVVVARLPQWPSQRSPNNRTYCVCRDDDLQNCFKFIAGCECLAQREPRQGNLKEDVVCVVIGCWLMSPSSSPATSPTMSNSSSPTPPAVSYNKITGIPCVAAASRYTAPVHIDVGGTIYTSSLETLTK
ncbi:hypothetical protein GEV33_014624 [Tenebrio molitor]|uniref:Uncharacterized protein n=1 Tax=Tenebrio molitor TaxID=7067 RepID=A0A8J6H5B5_TENMO|nr:hypothetical protein GEV33_014627 [Tenebrio molitor]KAH0808167.1 hypothetical protein GEV33_014624 [Tenebrio molitor]